MKKSLYEALADYGKSDVYPFHMPGHKRQISHFGEPFAIDITEIEGFDNLHHAEGILLEAQRRAAALYHAEETYYLINGSTCGILSALSACVRRGGNLLMARNCHKAAYHGALLRGLHATYLYPETDMVRGIYGSIRPEAVREALGSGKESGRLCSETDRGVIRGALEPGAGPEALGKERKIEAVLITSPTYDGVVSDVRAIAEEVHGAGAILIVDEAHGAHFGMHPYFPDHSLACGADIVINSLHKTLPSLTQTALLHVQGPRVDRERLRRYLGIYQTSSPSYVLMAGMDSCIRLLESEGPQLFQTFAARLEKLRNALSQMKILHLVTGKERELYCYDYDRSKILISTEKASICGPQLMELLRQRYHLEMEMEAEHYVTAITTIADAAEGFRRLEAALLEIDGRLAAESSGGTNFCGFSRELREDCGEDTPSRKGQEENGTWDLSHENEEVFTLAEAEEALRESIPLVASEGRVSAEFLYIYPPGIPLLVPGERISGELLGKLADYKKAGLRLQGLKDLKGEEIQVICDDEAMKFADAGKELPL